MVNEINARQFLGFDFNDYVMLRTSENPYGADAVGLYIAGTQANNLAVAPINALLNAAITIWRGPCLATRRLNGS